MKARRIISNGLKVSHGRVGSFNAMDGSILGRSPLASRKGVVREDRSEACLPRTAAGREARLQNPALILRLRSGQAARNRIRRPGRLDKVASDTNVQTVSNHHDNLSG